jgi:predicted hydrocarbon binding protein
VVRIKREREELIEEKTKTFPIEMLLALIIIVVVSSIARVFIQHKTIYQILKKTGGGG